MHQNMLGSSGQPAPARLIKRIAGWAHCFYTCQSAGPKWFGPHRLEAKIFKLVAGWANPLQKSIYNFFMNFV